MVDESMADQSEFCDELLQFMSPYFKQEVNFATTLIKQIVEAVETDGAIQKLKKNDEGKAVKRVFLLAQYVNLYSLFTVLYSMLLIFNRLIAGPTVPFKSSTALTTKYSLQTWRKDFLEWLQNF